MTTANGLDFTPAAGAAVQIHTGGLATFPAVRSDRMAGYLGGTLRGATYRGGADPAGTDRWR